MIAVPLVSNIIFDVDGTLLDSKRDIARAVLWVLQQFGVTHLKEEDIYPRIGRPLAVQLQELFPPELHARIPEAVEMYVAYYRPRALETTQLFPNVAEVLQLLKNAGINLAVATTKSTLTTKRVLTHFGIDRYFVRMQGTDGTPPKPDPHIIESILADHRWDKAATLMVGDTDVDVQAGKSAGVMTCGVTYGALTRAQMKTAKPSFLIDALRELPPLLGL